MLGLNGMVFLSILAVDWYCHLSNVPIHKEWFRVSQCVQFIQSSSVSKWGVNLDGNENIIVDFYLPHSTCNSNKDLL